MERVQTDLAELRLKNPVQADQCQAAFQVQFEDIKRRIINYRTGRLLPYQVTIGRAGPRQ
jgi:hypothetical protein